MEHTGRNTKTLSVLMGASREPPVRQTMTESSQEFSQLLRSLPALGHAGSFERDVNGVCMDVHLLARGSSTIRASPETDERRAESFALLQLQRGDGFNERLRPRLRIRREQARLVKASLWRLPSRERKPLRGSTDAYILI